MIYLLTYAAIATSIATLVRRTHPVSRCITLVVIAGYLPMTRLYLGSLHVVARFASLALLCLIAVLTLLPPPSKARKAVRRGEVRFLYDPLDTLPFLGVIGLASVIWSIYPLGTAVNGIYSIAMFFVIAFLARRRWPEPDRCEQDVIGMLIPLLMFIAWGLLSDVVDASYVWSGGRRAGVFANPNVLGHVGTVAGCLTWFLWRRRSISRASVVAAIGLCAYAVGISQSRAAIIGVLVAALTVVVSDRRSSTIAIALLIAGLGAGAFTLVIAVDKAPALSGVAARFGNDEGQAAVASRAELRSAALRTWQDRAVIGYGYGTTATAMVEIDRLDSARNGSIAVHNGYVQLLLELGLLGFLPTMAVGTHLLMAPFGRADGRPSAALHAGAVALAAVSIVESTFLAPMLITSAFLWILAAMSWAISEESNDDERTSENTAGEALVDLTGATAGNRPIGGAGHNVIV